MPTAACRYPQHKAACTRVYLTCSAVHGSNPCPSRRRFKEERQSSGTVTEAERCMALGTNQLLQSINAYCLGAGARTSRKTPSGFPVHLGRCSSFRDEQWMGGCLLHGSDLDLHWGCWYLVA